MEGTFIHLTVSWIFNFEHPGMFPGNRCVFTRGQGCWTLIDLINNATLPKQLAWKLISSQKMDWAFCCIKGWLELRKNHGATWLRFLSRSPTAYCRRPWRWRPAADSTEHTPLMAMPWAPWRPLKYTLTTKSVSTLKAGPCPLKAGAWRVDVSYITWKVILTSSEAIVQQKPQLWSLLGVLTEAGKAVGQTDRPENPSEKGRSKPSSHL